MCHNNNAVIMQTSQLGQIEALEDRVHNLKGKLEVQNTLINNLVSNNLNHLQANMTLTQHINRSEVKWANNQARFWNIKLVLWNLHHIVGVGTNSELSGPSTSDSGGDEGESQAGGKGSGEGGAVTPARARLEDPVPREMGLVEQMEEEAREAGLGGWFNGEEQRDAFPESWSGPNSNMSASQDQVHTMELTTIRGCTLPNLVRVPDSVVANGVLIPLMEGLIRLYQCLIWANQGSLLLYDEDPAPLFWCCAGHALIQIRPSFEDIDGEYGGAIEADEGMFD